VENYDHNAIFEVVRVLPDDGALPLGISGALGIGTTLSIGLLHQRLRLCSQKLAEKLPRLLKPTFPDCNLAQPCSMKPVSPLPRLHAMVLRFHRDRTSKFSLPAHRVSKPLAQFDKDPVAPLCLLLNQVVV
jgi:hypothetical protein